MKTPVTVGFAGSSNTANNTIGYRPKAMKDIITNQPQYTTTFLTTAVSGWATWPNLVNLSDLAGSNLVIFDQSNDDSTDTAHVEAYIRKAWATGARLISVVLPSFASIADNQVSIPDNETAINNHLAICTTYGIPVINFWQMCISLVPGTYHLSDLMANTAHMTDLGYTLIEQALNPYLVNGGASQPAALPSRVYAASADYENTPLIKNGTDYDSRTGIWADTGTRVDSSSAGATITYSGTFRTFGCYNAAATYPDVEVSVDGGAFQTVSSFYPNGNDLGVRAAHTIIVRVLTTVRIDEFWGL